MESEAICLGEVTHVLEQTNVEARDADDLSHRTGEEERENGAVAEETHSGRGVEVMSFGAERERKCKDCSVKRMW